MNICPSCDRDNREGALLCDHCGRALAGFASLQTHVMEAAPKSTDRFWQGTGQFTKDTQVILFVSETSDALVLPSQERLVLGRTNLDQAPDVDLTEYAALELGVSSQHAMLERSHDQMVIIDLASTNGTYLNRRQLQARRPAIVHDGAEVHLGMLALRLYFETPAVGPRQDHPAT